MRALQSPPLVGVIAFLSVLAVQPLGHIVMILMEQLIGEGEGWYSPIFALPPVIPPGEENLARIEPGLYLAAFGMGLVGAGIVFWGVRRNTEVAGTWAGFIGANLLWTGWVEFSLHYFARVFAVRALCADGSWAYSCAGSAATKPEYFLMQGSVGLLLAVVLYFALNGESRCHFFCWLHRRLHMGVGKPTSSGLQRNFANIVAVETIVLLWFFYVFLMFLYDETLFGERHWFTYLSFAGLAAWSLFLIQRLLRFRRVSSALRYAIPTAIVFWSAVEVMGRWNWFQEFWTHPLDFRFEALALAVCTAGFFLVSIRAALDRQKQID